MVSKSLLLTSSKFHIRPIRERVGCGIVHFPSGNRFVLEAGNFSHKRCQSVSEATGTLKRLTIASRHVNSQQYLQQPGHSRMCSQTAL